MTKKAETWMPLLVAKYLADTMHLSTEQHGGYLLLLMHAWMNKGALPIEDEKLRRITRMSPKAWAEHGDDIRGFFTEVDGALRQKRIDFELARANGNIEQRVAAGKASAERRAEQRTAQREGNETGNETCNEKATTVERTEQREGQRKGRTIPTPSSLRSEPPPFGAPLAAARPRPAKRCPPEFAPNPEAVAAMQLECPGVDLDRELRKMRDCEFSKPRSDWLAAWRTWMRKSFDDLGQRPKSAPLLSFRERDAAAAAARIREMTGTALDAFRDDDSLNEEPLRAAQIRNR